MKKLYTLLATSMLATAAFATQRNIAISGFSYTPATLQAEVGDQVTITGDFSFHPTVEVEQSTWNSNGSTPMSGGFSATNGNTLTFTVSAVGTRYYVCQNHVQSSNMKGQIVVSAPTAVKTASLLNAALYPNPAVSTLNLPDAITAGEVTVLSQGRVVRTLQLAAGERSLSVADLPAGLYQLMAGGRPYRFVKE